MPKQERSVLKIDVLFWLPKTQRFFLKGLVFFNSHNFSNLTRFQVQVRPHLEILCLLCAVVRHLVDGRYGSMQEKYLANHSLFFHRRETQLQSNPPKKKNIDAHFRKPSKTSSCLFPNPSQHQSARKRKRDFF